MGPIGQPRPTQPEICPSLFDGKPRRAPKTPERFDDGSGSTSGVGVGIGGVGAGMEVDEVITFESTSPRFPFPNQSLGGGKGSSPHTPQTPQTIMDIDLNTPRAPIGSMDLDTEFDMNDIQTSTPISQRHPQPTSSPSIPSPIDKLYHTGHTPPLTIKAVVLQQGKNQSKSRTRSRLLDLLPTYNRHLTLNSSSPTGDIDKPLSSTKKKSFLRGAGIGGKNASTPNLKNGLPFSAMPTSSLHLGSTTTTTTTTTANARQPLGTLPVTRFEMNGRNGRYGNGDGEKGSGYGYRSGAVSRAEHSTYLGEGDKYGKSEEGKQAGEDVRRPSTSTGHHYHYYHYQSRSKPLDYPHQLPSHHTDTNPNPDENYPLASYPAPHESKSHSRRRVPDFSRPMSTQDLDISLTSSQSVHHYQLDEDRTMDIHTPILPVQSNYDMEVDMDMEEVGVGLGVGIGGGHERMDSQDSTQTAETGDTFGGGTSASHSILSKVSAASLGSGVGGYSVKSGISGNSGISGSWELERYLKELEEEEDGYLGLGVESGMEMFEGGGGLERGGTVKERAERLDRKIVALDSESEIPVGSGKKGLTGGFGNGGVIQQAKYGIRI